MPNLNLISSDVLSIIFEHCIPNPDSEYELSKTEASLNVSATCRYWRQIALSTSTLWACICVTYDRTRKLDNFKPLKLDKFLRDKRFQRVIVDMLGTFITRSGGQQLSVVVKCYGPDNRENGGRLDSFYDPLYVAIPLLLGCKNRWEALIVRTPEMRLWEMLLIKNDSPAPQLKNIDIVRSSFQGSWIHLHRDLAPLIPVVEHISFTGCTMFMDGCYSSLKKLDIDVGVINMSDLQPRLPELEELSVKCRGPLSIGWSLNFVPAEFPNLRVLIVTFFHSEPISHYRENPLFSYFLMPNLTELRVHINGQSRCPSYAFRDVSRLISVSRPALQTLKIFFDGQTIVPDEYPILFDIFRRTPSLRFLHVTEGVIDKHVVDKLALEADQEVFLPSLAVLLLLSTMSDLLRRDDGKAYVKSLRDLLRSRDGENEEEWVFIVYLGEGGCCELLSSEEGYRDAGKIRLPPA